MARFTRAATQINSNEISIFSRPRRQATKPVIFSSESEDDCSQQEAQSPPITPRKTKSRTDITQLSQVTPPKLKKVEQKHYTTPVKASENIYIPTTPSTLLKELVLDSPIKNSCKSRVKKLEFCKQSESAYTNARKALHSTFPSDMPCREKELAELKGFIVDHLSEETSGTLYISGPPGTGKTACLNVILQDEEIMSEVHHIYVNCTAIKSAGSIYSRIVKELGLKCASKSERENRAAVNTYLTKNHKMILLVLDEIDQLDSKKQSVLYTIFEWPAKPNSRLILIGIANALDLTDRILPRLQARCELKPRLMNFAPYSKQQIVDIFITRLKQAGVEDVFLPVALQMLAGKVASVSGDVRKALDIGRRVIEIVRNKETSNVLKPIENLAGELAENDNNENQTKSVDLKQVVSVLNNVYGTSQSLNDVNEDTFPLQQKIIICSLILMLKKAKNKDITIGRLHEVYRKVCAKCNLLGVDQAEFVGLCSLIETKGIIRVTGRKEPRLHKVSLQWDEEEVSNALKDKQLMSTILDDVSCLGKM